MHDPEEIFRLLGKKLIIKISRVAFTKVLPVPARQAQIRDINVWMGK